MNHIETQSTPKQNSSLGSVTRLRRSLSHKRKYAKKIPLIKRELELETNDKKVLQKLVEAIVECNLDLLKNLLDNGVSIHARLNDWSLLHYACSIVDQVYSGSEKHIQTIDYLIQAGADINSKDEDAWTPLHLACQSGLTRVIS